MKKQICCGYCETPVGRLWMASSETGLVATEFNIDERTFKEKVELLGQSIAVFEINSILNHFIVELEAYFGGIIQNFSTPIQLLGTPFLVRVWEEISKIPYGATLTVNKLCAYLGRPRAYKIVLEAIYLNRLAILVPAHRMINTLTSGICSNCKEKIKQDSKFCHSCGIPLSIIANDEYQAHILFKLLEMEEHHLGKQVNREEQCIKAEGENVLVSI